MLQNHEQHIANNGSIAQEMAQYIDGLIEDNENMSLWIGMLMRESKAQAQVLQQHRLGQEVIAEVIKKLMAEQQSQQRSQQVVFGNGPTVSELDEDNGTDRDFQTGQNPHTRPPDNGEFGVANEPLQVPTSMEIVEQF